MIRDCVRYAPMIGSRPGELTDLEAHALSSHLEGCPTCRALAAELEATDGLVAEALMARANARDFAPFVDEVMARVGRGTPARVSLLGRLRQRWKPLAISAAALLVLAAGSALIYREATFEEPERVAAVQMELQGGSTVLQTTDGPVVLFEPDDDTGS